MKKQLKKIPVIFEGIMYPSISACCKATGRNYSCVQDRLRRGMSFEDAMSLDSFRNVKSVIFEGVTYASLKECCKATGRDFDRVWYRLRRGMSFEDAMSLNSFSNAIPVTFEGVTYANLKECCKATGRKYDRTRMRLKSGLPLEEAMCLDKRDSTHGTTVEWSGIVYKNVKQCCECNQKNYGTILNYIRMGMTFEEAMSFKDEKKIEIEYQGIVYPSLMKCCEANNKNYSRVYYRYNNMKMSIEDAMSFDDLSVKKQFEYDGVRYSSYKEFCDKMNINYNRFRDRILRGFSISQAINIPKHMSFGECKVAITLDNMNVSYLHNKTIKDVFRILNLESQYHVFMKAYQESIKSNDEMIIDLKRLSRFRFDFAITRDNNLFGFIEYDGKQHNSYVKCFHKTLEQFLYRCNADDSKTLFAELGGIPLLRIRNDQDDYIEEMIIDFLENPGFYVHQHNKFLSNEEYYEERNQILNTEAFVA